MRNSCPIRDCASNNGLPSIGKGISMYQCLSVTKSCWVILGSVFCVFIHLARSARANVQMCCAVGSQHCTMWCLVSKVTGHLGHWAVMHNFHHCILFQCTKFPDTNLETHCLLVSGSDAITIPIASQLFWCHMASISCQVAHQYLAVKCPLTMWLCRLFWGSLTTSLWPR